MRSRSFSILRRRRKSATPSGAVSPRRSPGRSASVGVGLRERSTIAGAAEQGACLPVATRGAPGMDVHQANDLRAHFRSRARAPSRAESDDSVVLATRRRRFVAAGADERGRGVLPANHGARARCKSHAPRGKGIAPDVFVGSWREPAGLGETLEIPLAAPGDRRRAGLYLRGERGRAKWEP